MRVCIYGAGAVGGHLAARLAAAGAAVSVVARGAHLEAIRARGLTLLRGDDRTLARVRASDRPADLGPQDVVFVTLKANLLPAFAAAAAPLLGPDTAVVFVQNGIPWWYAQGLGHPLPPGPELPLPDLARLDPGARLAGAIAPERVVGAVAYTANSVAAPGEIHNHTPGTNMVVLGEPDDRDSPRIRQLRGLLDKSGVASPAAPGIRQVVWNKLVQNLGGSALSLLTEQTVAGMRADPAVWALSSRLGAEGRAIARAYGIDIDGAPARPGGGHGAGAIAHKPSMLQDYERGRPLELEAQLLAPHAFARAAGVATPTLDMIVPLAAAKAASKGLHKKEVMPQAPPAAQLAPQS